MRCASDGLRVRNNWRAMELSRVWWGVTVVGALVIALVLLLDGYSGYAGVSAAVAASAAINLF